MSSEQKPRIREVFPSETWAILEQDTSAALVDVRTREEWAFVGIPDLTALNRPLLQVEWARLPDMSLNPHFVGEVVEQLGDSAPNHLLFLCRSGVRSLRAAELVQDYLVSIGQDGECLNVATGFEGDLNDDRHRGHKNGWKVAGLPWRQS